MLDSYTIRKAVPRILIAAIAINLSVYLCVALIDIVNVVGHGLATLIVTPFQNTNSEFHRIALENNSTNITVGVMGVLGLLASVFGVGAAIATGSLGILIGGGLLAALPIIAGFMITASLIILAVVFTLVLRQALIIFCVMVAPVAIALFVLPGTEKYFKKWLDLFTSTLMVYPIVATLFAMSTVLTTILLGTSDSSGSATIGEGIGLAKILAAIVVAFAPLVMIPFAFKLAGGAISAVMNAGVGGSKTLSRSARAGLEKMKQDPNSLYGKAYNRNKTTRYDRGLTAGQAASGVVGGFRNLGQGQKFGSGYSSASRALARDKRMQRLRELGELESAQPIKNNDDYLKAIMAGESAQASRDYLSGIKDKNGKQVYSGQNLEDSLAAIERMKATGAYSEVKQWATMQNATTGTGFGGGPAEMIKAINDAVGDDRVLANNMLGMMRPLAGQARRPDLAAGGFGSHSNTMQELYDGDITMEEANKKLVKEAIAANNGGNIVNAKPTQIKSLFAPEMLDSIQQASDKLEASTTPEEIDTNHRALMQQLASAGGIYDAMTYASPEAAQALSDGLFAKEVTVIDNKTGKPTTTTVGAMMTDAEKSTEFQQTRKVFGQSSLAGYQANQQHLQMEQMREAAEKMQKAAEQRPPGR